MTSGLTRDVMVGWLNDAERAMVETELNVKDDAVVHFAAAATVAQGLEEVAASVQRLGNADADAPMGAIENLTKEIMSGLEELSRAATSIGDALREKTGEG